MADYVTVDEVRSAIGIQDLYSDVDIEFVCEAATDLVRKMLWFNEYPVIGGSISSNVVTLVLSTPAAISATQQVVVTGSGTSFNGTHTVTGTYPWTTGSAAFNWWAVMPFVRNTFPNGYSMIQWVSPTPIADQNYHLIVPYGKVAVTPETHGDYADQPLVRLSALELAIDMWQSRQQSNAGGVSPDGTPSPYRMGNSLLSRVRGLLAPFISPRSMVG